MKLPTWDKSEAAPATVSGERLCKVPLVNLGGEGGTGARTREPGDLPDHLNQYAVGCDGKEDKEMNNTTTAVAATKSPWLPVIFAAMLGLGVIVITGHVQAETLHDAAHDVRHATGFPCH